MISISKPLAYLRVFHSVPPMYKCAPIEYECINYTVPDAVYAPTSYSVLYRG